MRMYDLILKKRNGEVLSKEEIDFFVQKYTKGEVPDYQASAFLMAIFFQKMNEEETVNLTMSIVNSGETIDLSDIDGVKVDKHSTGGVGDTTSLVLGPMVAALGIPVAKMSGRGLGHTGGTIDKLESFEGFSVEMTREKFVDNVNTLKLAIAGQSADLAPADKKLYALRDVTATVDNISLIASSIMSKKLASGAEAIVLDVKVGDGAFMKTPEDARKLAEAMVSIGKGVGRNTVAIISDMDQPLGRAIGNALEVKEAIETLKGNGPKDLLDLCLALGSNMVVLAGAAKNEEEAKKMLLGTIESGSALKALRAFVKAQGGDATMVDDMNKLPGAEFIVDVKAEKSGVISKINAQNIGIVAMELGAGRATKEDIIDLGVGIIMEEKRGSKVSKGDIIAKVYANDMAKAERAVKGINENIKISEKFTDDIPLIYDIVK